MRKIPRTLLYGGEAFLLLAVIVVALALYVGGGSDPQTSLRGTWVGNSDAATMEAIVGDNDIQIMWKTDDTTALYWKGTFPFDGIAEDGTTITSRADKVALETSFLASQDPDKTFIYKDGKLTFELRVMGVTKTVKLSK